MPKAPFEIVTIPCLSDNYAFLIGNTETGEAALVDIPEAAPINAELAARSWTLTSILITHHHPDHVQGLNALTKSQDTIIIGAAADAHRLPELSTSVNEGDALTILGLPVTIFDVSGHTIGHLAFYFADLDAAFTADSLMALGCGRLFEGTPAQMWDSLNKLMALPPETWIFSGHEYTASNAKFALTVDPNNADLQNRAQQTVKARQDGIPTVPSQLSLERATNPFLRAEDTEIAAHLNMSGRPAVDVFTEIRLRKDAF